MTLFCALVLGVYAGACTRGTPAPDRDGVEGAPSESPLILQVAGQGWTWADLESFLRLDIDTLPPGESLTAEQEAWLLRVGEGWFDHVRLLDSARRSEVAFDEKAFRNWIQSVTMGYGGPPALAALLQRKGLSFSVWERIQRERFWIQEWEKAEWGLSPAELKSRARAYYDRSLKETPKEFRRETAVHLRHLVTDSREKTAALRARVVRGEGFAKLAIENSQTPDRLKGGDLGFLTHSELLPVFAEVCFSLKEGELSPVVESEYGYHLFKVMERRPERVLAFEEVESQLTRKLEREWLEKNEETWLAEERSLHEETLNWKVIEAQFKARLLPEFGKKQEN